MFWQFPGQTMGAEDNRNSVAIRGSVRWRVIDQFRVCFPWTAAGAEDVEIVDYH